MNAVVKASVSCLDREATGAAKELVFAQFELLRIRSVRSEMMALIEANAIYIDTLPRLAALDRYERLANTKRQRASRKLKM